MRIPKKRSTNSPSDIEWNVLVDFVLSLQPAACRDMYLHQTPHGFTHKPMVGVQGSSSTIKMCVLSSVEANYLICNEGTTVGITINVAKPYELRESRTSETLYSITSPSSSRWTATITYSDSDFYENRKQVVDDTGGIGTPENRYATPIWEPGLSLIFAGKCDHTGVTVDGSELTWIDLNVGGRVWAKEFAPPA